MSEDIQGVVDSTTSKYESRKYRLALFILFISTGLLAWNKLTGTEYVNLMMATVAAYITGNVAQKYLEAKAK